MEAGFESARLEELDRDPNRPEWIPIRRRFGISAFGVNAWAAAGPGDELIPEHDESSIGHEELYVVVDGHATFTVGGEEIDAPAGTIACAKALLGETEEALEHLTRAVELNPPFAETARDEADFASIRNDPRFPGS